MTGETGMVVKLMRNVFLSMLVEDKHERIEKPEEVFEWSVGDILEIETESTIGDVVVQDQLIRPAGFGHAREWFYFYEVYDIEQDEIFKTYRSTLEDSVNGKLDTKEVEREEEDDGIEEEVLEKLFGTSDEPDDETAETSGEFTTQDAEDGEE